MLTLKLTEIHIPKTEETYPVIACVFCNKIITHIDDGHHDDVPHVGWYGNTVWEGKKQTVIYCNEGNECAPDRPTHEIWRCCCSGGASYIEMIGTDTCVDCGGKRDEVEYQGGLIVFEVKLLGVDKGETFGIEVWGCIQDDPEMHAVAQRVLMDYLTKTNPTYAGVAFGCSVLRHGIEDNGQVEKDTPWIRITPDGKILPIAKPHGMDGIPHPHAI